MPSGPTSSKEFARWFRGSVAVEPNGTPMTFFHGSSADAITEFKYQHTSYGYFFSPDETTAAYYGDYIYRVHLRIKKLAELGMEGGNLLLRKVLKSVFQFEATAVFRYDEHYGVRGKVSTGDIQRWFAETILTQSKAGAVDSAVLAWSRGFGKRWVAGGGDWQDLQTPTGLASALDDADFDDDAIMRLVKRAKKLQQDFRDDDFCVERPSVIDGEAAYGGQDFYRNYQDDVMHELEGTGYDGVQLMDQSHVGESESWVIFRPEQIWIVGMEHQPRKPRRR